MNIYFRNIFTNLYCENTPIFYSTITIIMTNSKVDDRYEINDIRPPTAFKGISFSKYKKTDVKIQLEQSMLKGKIEPACYWSAELICAGHYTDLWEILLHYIGKYIHLGNPKLVIYLEMRYELFRNLMSTGFYINELQLRNNSQMRKLFAEIITTVTLSNKKHSFEPIRINRIEEFDMTQMTERLKAPSTKYAESVLLKDDPKELLIAVNEFAYNISKDRINMTTACYWIEWMIDFDTICKKRKEPVYAERRKVSVENKYQCDIIWILWDALKIRVDEINNEFISKIAKSLKTIFSIKYTTASCKKRRYLLYYAVALVTEPVLTNIELISNKQVIQTVVDKIDEVYKQIKKNEESPNMEYLFSNVDKQNNFEKSVKKLEIMETLTSSVPRMQP